MNKEKNILVSFSGGLDSTYLVYNNLKKGHYVTGLYTTIENNKNKATVEKYQIEKISELLMKEFPGKFTLHYGISIDVPFSGGLIFKQIVIWLMSLLYHDPRYDEVQIGAVMNDDMLSYIDDIKRIWGSFAFLNEKHPPLIFPLTKKSKLHIARDLPKVYRDLVVYCEDPVIIEPITKKNKELKFENCNNCHSCKRYKFDSDFLGIEYGQIKPRESLDEEYIESADIVKKSDFIVGLSKSNKDITNKISIQKLKPFPEQDPASPINTPIFREKKRRPIIKIKPIKKKRK